MAPMKMLKIYLSVFIFFYSLGISSLTAQIIDLKGSVTDPGMEPLIGASILVQESQQGTITDINGTFQLKVAANATLIISYTGFTTRKINIGNQTSWYIVLEPEDLTLDEIVVIGYGSQRKSQITGAISSLKGKDIQNQPVSNLANSMQGRVAGMNVMSASGTPGSGLL